MTTTAQVGVIEARSDRAVRALEALTAPGGAEKSLSLEQYARLWRSGADIGGANLGGPSNAYRQALWVYRSVFVLATTAAGVPLRLSRGEAAGTRAVMGRKHCRQGLKNLRRPAVRGEKAALRAAPGDLVEGGPLWELLQRPNSDSAWESTWPRLMKRTVALMMLPPGRCLWHLADLVGRRPRALRIVPGEWTTPITPSGNRQDEIVGWQVRTPWGSAYRLLPEEVIVWANLNPYEPQLGLSPTEPANLAIVSDYNASLYNAAMFGNSAEPGGVLRTDAPYNAEQDEALRMAWMQRHQGPARAKATAVLWGGLGYQPVASSMQEMQYDAGKRLVRTEEVGAFGVSEVVAGFYSDANYQFAEQGREQFWQDTMMPLFDDVGEGIQVHLVPRFDENLEAWFDLEDVPIIQKMRIARVDAVVRLADQGVPMEDLNDLYDLGLPPRPWYATGFINAGRLPASAAADATMFSPEGETPYTEGVETGNRKPETGNRKEAPAARGLASVEKKSERQRLARIAARLWAVFAAEYETLARKGRGFLRLHFARQEEAVIKALEEALLSGGYRPLKCGVRNAECRVEKSEWEPVMDKLLVDVFRDLKERNTFRARLRSYAADGQKVGLRQALVEAGLSGDALAEALKRLTSLPAIQASLASDAVRVSTLIDRYTRDRLKVSLAEGLQEGETIRELATRVQTFMGNRRASAVVIARNAIGQTLSRARHEGHKATGMTHRIWIHSRGPGERRPAHVAAEGYYTEHPVGMDEPFVINGVRLLYPRDFSSGHPEETVNCQCAAIAKRAEAGEEPTAAGILEHHAKRIADCGVRSAEYGADKSEIRNPKSEIEQGDGDADAD